MHDFIIPEYADNDFIKALGPIRDAGEVLQSLNERIEFDESERLAAPHHRLRLVMRLRRFFRPMAPHLEIESKLSLALYEGYVFRNPNTLEFKRHQRAARRRLAARQLDLDGARVRNNASGFAIIGVSGVGKSFCVERILETWPRTKVHHKHGRIVQVIWVKVDCPHKGSKRALCIAILTFLDKWLGQGYAGKYGHTRNTAEDLVFVITNLFVIHAVGILIIDEIQNLYNVKTEDNSSLMSFFVLLVNTIGVPVVLMGTLSARPLFNSAFATARRNTALGSVIRYPLPRGKTDADDWPTFVRTLWRGQWTSTKTELSKPILDALYEHTQGVLDLVVILYMLCQFELIQMSATHMLAGRGPVDETITKAVIDAVAAKNFTLVRGMVEALKAGNEERLKDYEDLSEFHELIDDTFARRRVETDASVSASGVDLAAATAEEQTANLLKRLGFAPNVITSIMSQLPNAGKGLSPTDIGPQLGGILEGLKANPSKPSRRRRRTSPYAEDDLRRLVSDGKYDGLDPLNTLTRHGHVRPLEEDFR